MVGQTQTDLEIGAGLEIGRSVGVEQCLVDQRHLRVPPVPIRFGEGVVFHVPGARPGIRLVRGTDGER